MPSIDIVVFACAGREHLLGRTLRTLDNSIRHNSRMILVVDGPFSLAGIDGLGIDLILQGTARAGYLASITRALELVKTPLFLWLEDDWDVTCLKNGDILHAAAFLQQNPNFVQVRWPKDSRSNGNALTSIIMHSTAGFSANPNLANTSAVKALFRDLEIAQNSSAALPLNLGFETFCTQATKDHGLQLATFDYRHTGIVGHLGDLESTDRKWHYVGMQDPTESAPINRVTLLARFVVYAIRVATIIPFSRRVSEVAFRFVTLLKGEGIR